MEQREHRSRLAKKCPNTARFRNTYADDKLLLGKLYECFNLTSTLSEVAYLLPCPSFLTFQTVVFPRHYSLTPLAHWSTPNQGWQCRNASRLLSYSSTDFHLGPFFAVCRGSSFESLSSVDDQQSTAYLERSFANTLHAKFNMQRRTRQLSATDCAPTVPACLCERAVDISSRGNVNGVDVPSVPSCSETVHSSPLFEGGNDGSRAWSRSGS